MANEGEYPKVDGDVLYASEVNSFIRNKAKGLTPTTDLAPAIPITDLTNITDEDNTTGTNVFSITGQTAKEVKIDLGALYFVHKIGVKYDYALQNASDACAVETSPDDSDWTEVTGLDKRAGTGTVNLWGDVGFDANKVRYVRFIITGSGGGPNTLKIYELVTI